MNLNLQFKYKNKLFLSDGIKTSNEFESIDGASYAIVATQGKGDMRSIRSAIASDPEYFALIASKRKGDKLMNRLLKKGINKNDLKKLNIQLGWISVLSHRRK